MANVFLSHVDEDFPVIKEIADRLEKDGWTTWYYERDSVPGIPHPTQTREAIEQADAFLVLISAQCLGAPGKVRREIFRAMDLDKHFIPLLLEVPYGDVKQRQPQWDDAFVGAVAAPVPRSDPSAVVPQVAAALHRLGVLPEPRGHLQEKLASLQDRVNRAVEARNWELAFKVVEEALRDAEILDSVASLRRQVFRALEQDSASHQTLGRRPLSTAEEPADDSS